VKAKPLAQDPVVNDSHHGTLLEASKGLRFELALDVA
jgi:hypothetical protein